ncbi:MAG: DUF2062 domain-containing protein [Marinobacterium sp.]|nr:DUF2062 domain-containing protein [Marinobacterium sp.]
MPRKLIKKYMPNEDTLRNHKHLSWMGSHLHDPNLWHMNRKSVSRAFAVGIFCAFLPIPMQMLVAAVMALFARSNLPISVGLVWLTNPVTMPPIFYTTYQVGAWLLGSNELLEFEMTMEWITESISHIWWPLLFGSVVCGIIAAIAAYFTIRICWAWSVGKNWQNRQKRRRCR